jgi:hypothetical protein
VKCFQPKSITVVFVQGLGHTAVGPGGQVFRGWWEGQNNRPMIRTHGFAGCSTSNIRVLHEEGVVDNIVDFLGEDAGYIAEVEDHAVIWSLGVANQFSTDFGLEPVPVAMKVGTLAAVVWHTVAGVGFDPAADGGGHASSS